MAAPVVELVVTPVRQGLHGLFVGGWQPKRPALLIVTLDVDTLFDVVVDVPLVALMTALARYAV